MRREYRQELGQATALREKRRDAQNKALATIGPGKGRDRKEQRY